MSSVNDSHFSCGILYRENPESQRIEFLVEDVISEQNGRAGKKQTKFPGGNNRLNCIPEETPALTAQREILEETYLTVSPDHLKQVWVKEAMPDRSKPGKHVKYAFLVPFSECQGTLRTEVLRDNNDTMEAPYWLSPEDMKFRLFAGHQEAFLLACRELGLM